jgi:transposase InsO family protein
VADITYIRLARRFLYLAVILDAFTRAVRGWALSRSLEQQLTLDALEMALSKGTPVHLPFRSRLTIRSLEPHRTAAHAGSHHQYVGQSQSDAKRLGRALHAHVNEEHVDYSEYRDFEDAYQ